MSELSYQLVESTEMLEQAVQACRSAPVVAIDTEFARFNTYYPIVGLIQLYDGKACYLIDPLECESIKPLAELLMDTDVVKVVHAGSEDMEVFQYELGIVPVPVFDTQVAAGVMGIGFSMGYQALVENLLHITVPKDQTRSDWLARPLTPEQLQYAALDVVYLHQVYDQMIPKLQADGKLDWAVTESALLGHDIPTTIDPEECYKKVKGLWQLDRFQLNELKALFAWRERKARDKNMPRNRLIDQKSLVTVVKENLESAHLLQSRAGFSSRQVRKYAEEIFSEKQQARNVSLDNCPQLFDKADTPINNKKLKKLRQVVEQESKRLSVAPEMLVKRRHLEKLLRSEDASGNFHLPEELSGWRASTVGVSLLAALVD